MIHNAVWIDGKWFYLQYGDEVDVFDLLYEEDINFMLSPSCEECEKDDIRKKRILSRRWMDLMSTGYAQNPVSKRASII